MLQCYDIVIDIVTLNSKKFLHVLLMIHEFRSDDLMTQLGMSNLTWNWPISSELIFTSAAFWICLTAPTLASKLK